MVRFGRKFLKHMQEFHPNNIRFQLVGSHKNQKHKSGENGLFCGHENQKLNPISFLI